MFWKSTFLEMGHQNNDKKNWFGPGPFFWTWVHLKGSVDSYTVEEGQKIRARPSPPPLFAWKKTFFSFKVFHYRLVSQRWDNCTAWSSEETSPNLSDDLLQVVVSSVKSSSVHHSQVKIRSHFANFFKIWSNPAWHCASMSPTTLAKFWRLVGYFKSR